MRLPSRWYLILSQPENARQTGHNELGEGGRWAREPSRANQLVEVEVDQLAGPGRIRGSSVAALSWSPGPGEIGGKGTLANRWRQQIEQLDLAYAPPLAPAYDPVLIAPAVARKSATLERDLRTAETT
jgi:hypothetical protein